MTGSAIKQVNKLKPQFLGMHALNAFAPFNSSARSVMFGNHFCQRLVVSGADEKLVQTGVEQEFSKYTFSTKMPVNGRVVRVIERYPHGINYDTIKFNPETIVVFENDETGELDYISIPYYQSYHQFFGFKNKPIEENVAKLYPGSYVRKDTIFADSPAVSENGGYKIGVNLNMAMMSVPGVAEDGFVVSRTALDKLKFRIYERRVVSCGRDMFPLNIAGTLSNYMCFPEIGDYMREDGAIMIMREYSREAGIAMMSAHDVMDPDYSFDRPVYIRGGDHKSGNVGRVVDIKVIGNNSVPQQIPSTMTGQLEKYRMALIRFHQDILRVYKETSDIRKKKFGNPVVPVSRRFHRLLVESQAIVNTSPNEPGKVGSYYRKEALDDYRIEFVVEYEITPNIGFKLTGFHGCKGTIVKIEEPENMPVDAAGNRAEIISDFNATANRMNVGRLYEHYFNGAVRDTRKRVQEILGREHVHDMDDLMSLGIDRVNKAYEFLLNTYFIVSERQFEHYSVLPPEKQHEHVLYVMQNQAYFYMPIDFTKHPGNIITELEKFNPPTYGPVSYVGNSGIRCTTVDNVRIAPMYMMLLEKIADEWSSVSYGKFQHFGVLSPVTKAEKFASPWRMSHVRFTGETEVRLITGICGQDTIAEIMDRSNNPSTVREMSRIMLTADKPSNIDLLVDRNEIPYGNNKPLQLFRHILYGFGVKPVYEPETDTFKYPSTGTF